MYPSSFWNLYDPYMVDKANLDHQAAALRDLNLLNLCSGILSFMVLRL